MNETRLQCQRNRSTIALSFELWCRRLGILSTTPWVRVFVAFCAVAIAGCNNSSRVGPEPSIETNDSLNEMEASGDYDPRFTTKWTMPDGSKHEKVGNVVTAAILEKEFRQLDWSKPASGPSLAVERAGDNVLSIVLYPDATKSQEQLIAVWTRPGPKLGVATSKIVRRSKPFQDAELALALLNRFAVGDDAFESLVEWDD